MHGTFNATAKLMFECFETQILSYILVWPHFSLWLQEYLDLNEIEYLPVGIVQSKIISWQKFK